MHYRKKDHVTSDGHMIGDQKELKTDQYDSNKLFRHINNNKFLVALAVRLLSCALARTYFVADEYWQSTEVAHYKAFNYGHVTWEWREKIRSYLYPFIFEVYFRILHFLSIDSKQLVIVGPHVIQATLTAFADVSVYKLALNVHKSTKIAFCSFLLSLISWFLFYTGSRTLSNTAEMCFSSIGLAYLPFEDIQYSRNLNGGNSQSLKRMLLFAGIACIIRPTCLLLWVPLIILSLCYNSITILDTAKAGVVVFPVLVVLCFGVDYYFYESVTLAHWNFAKFNVVQNIGVFYGSHPMYWYILQGIPVVIGFYMVFIIVGVVSGHGFHRLFFVLMFHIFVHSLIPHKEFRFLLPLFPIFMCSAGQGLHLCTRYLKVNTMLLMMTFLNAPMAFYFSAIHQQGNVHVINLLSTIAKHDDSILFLMPCHSTPYYSYIHQNISMRFLTCEPPLPSTTTRPSTYVCESDQFFADPNKWMLDNETFDINDWTYVVMYNKLSSVLHEYLKRHNLAKETSIFHTHFMEGNIGSHIDVYKKKRVN